MKPQFRKHPSDGDLIVRVYEDGEERVYSRKALANAISWLQERTPRDARDAEYTRARIKALAQALSV